MDANLTACGKRESGSRKSGFIRFAMSLVLMVMGIALFLGGWLTPVYWNAVDAAVLQRMGKESGNLEEAAYDYLDRGKPGVARLFLEAWEQLDAKNEGTPLREAIEAAEAGGAALRLWGVADPYLYQGFSGREQVLARKGEGVISLLMERDALRTLASLLEASERQAVHTILENRSIRSTNRFPPATSAAGRPLDATLLLTALLFQGDTFSRGLGTEVREISMRANHAGELIDAESLYLDLFALAKRLDWSSFAELVPLLNSKEDLRRTAHVVRLAEDDYKPVIAAMIWTEKPRVVADFLMDNGEPGMGDLRFALLAGESASRHLFDRGLRVHHKEWMIPQEADIIGEAIASMTRGHPDSVVLSLKHAAFFSGFFLILLSLQLFHRPVQPALRQWGIFTLGRSLMLALALGLIILIFSEPFIADEQARSEFQFRLQLSEQSQLQAPQELTATLFNVAMDQILYLSLLIFFVLQLLVYSLCLIKLAEIRRQPLSSNLKLQLLENEENLFDTGLYVGLAGTVGSLIFLALGIVDPSLMAAYASTLFGIICVAMVKIFHLRPYKRRLILESQAY